MALNKVGDHPRGMFISPDGRWIAYQAGLPNGRDNELRRLPIDGGPTTTICPLGNNMRGGSWAEDGTIVFATIEPQTGLLRVPAAGGTPEVLTTPVPADGEQDHLWPQHLPDGRHVLFAISRIDGTFDAALLSLETKQWRVVVKDAMSPRYVLSGHLVYATAAVVRAVAFDPVALAVTGDPIEVQPDVLTKDSGAADFAVSASGTLVYLPGGTTGNAHRLAWREPDGRETPVRVPPQNYQLLRVSPEGRRAIALVSPRQGMPGAVWLIDLVRETAIRLTPAELPVNSAIWHPDGQQIVFATWSPVAPVESRGVFRIGVSGTGLPEQLVPGDNPNRLISPATWTPDGSHLLLTMFTGPGQADVARLAVASPSEITPVIAGPLHESGAALSPDGRWLAYVLTEIELEVFVRPYPDVNAARIPASNGPGQAPVWSRDGRQLYYATPGTQQLMATDVESTPGGIAFGKPMLVMALRNEMNELLRVALPPVNGRILQAVRMATTADRPSEYRVVLNWVEELRRR